MIWKGTRRQLLFQIMFETECESHFGCLSNIALFMCPSFQFSLHRNDSDETMTALQPCKCEGHLVASRP